MIHIARIPGTLPDGLAALAAEARTENVKNLTRLIEDWESGEERFETDGAGLFAAYLGDEIIAMGGTTRQLGTAHPAMRMRRFYVAARARRDGVATMLANTVIDQARQSSRLLTVNAQASEAAGPFWRSMGFVPARGGTITHLRWCDL